ncbi:MAG: SWIM zinc finger family protein [Azospirillaceae bacterium]|nr:SWIM zinc finger family protein [Azospirillaceae bacterium]
MASNYDGWPRYVPVAERRQKAEREMAKLRKKGQPVAPVVIEGRSIARTFWGKAWCDNLESYHDYANRLPRGRTYVRNGSVIDLQIAPLGIKAMVSGSSIYHVAITIKALPAAPWQAICRDCTGGIDSLVELLQGRFSKGVMERLCRQDHGLFPRPAEIKFSCSCPDGAAMCKHVAAVLYGVGARLDDQPELLFRLRAVNEKDLVADLDRALPTAARAPTAGKVLESDDVSALFGLDMAADDEGAGSPAPDPAPAPAVKTAPAPRRPAGRVKPRSESKDRPAAKDESVPETAIELTPDGYVKWWK